MSRLQLSAYYDSAATYKIYYIYTYHLKDKNLSKASLKQGNLLSYLEKSHFLPKTIYPDAHPPIVYYRNEYTAYRDSVYTYGCRAFDTAMTNMHHTFMSVLDSVCEREGIYNPAKYDSIRTKTTKTNIPKILKAIIEDVDKHTFYTWNYWDSPWIKFDKKHQSDDKKLAQFLRNKECVLFINPGAHGFYIAITHDKKVLFFDTNDWLKPIKRIDIDEYINSLWFLEF